MYARFLYWKACLQCLQIIAAFSGAKNVPAETLRYASRCKLLAGNGATVENSCSNRLAEARTLFLDKLLLCNHEPLNDTPTGLLRCRFTFNGEPIGTHTSLSCEMVCTAIVNFRLEVCFHVAWAWPHACGSVRRECQPMARDMRLTFAASRCQLFASCSLCFCSIAYPLCVLL